MRQDLTRLWFSPLFDTAVWSTEDRLPLVNDWAALVARITSEREGAREALKVQEVALDSVGQLTIRYTFDGPHAAEVRAECGLLIEAVTRMISARSWRWDESLAWIKPVRPTWVEGFKLLYDPWWASCPIDVEDGWVDLIEAMGLWACDLTGGPADDPRPWLQMKEKFGSLRVYHGWPVDHPLTAAIYACQTISGLLCETCGSPGSLQDGDHYPYTACWKHLR